MSGPAVSEQELEPWLAKLRESYDVLPFLEAVIPASTAVFRRLPDEMVDIVVASPDFTVPGRGTGPVWLQLETGGGTATIIVARPAADGELWVIAPEGKARGGCTSGMENGQG